MSGSLKEQLWKMLGSLRGFSIIKLGTLKVLRSLKGGFPVMAEITRILAANICRQFFFVMTTTVSTRCLVENFQLICYSQQINATLQYNDCGSQDVQNGRIIGWFQW